MVANAPLLKAAFHSLVNDLRLADRPGRQDLVRLVPGALDRRVGVHDEVVALVEVRVAGGLARLLHQDRVVGVGGRVEEVDLLVRRTGLELLAGGDVVVPRRPELRDRGAVGGQPGRLEQVAPVAHGQAADVGAEADRVLAVGGGGLVVLPVQPVALDVVRSELLEVDELVRRLQEADDRAFLDGDHVACAAPGRDVLRQSRRVLAEVALGLLDDRDVRVRRHVLRVQVLVAEQAEVLNLEGDLLGRCR